MLLMRERTFAGNDKQVGIDLGVAHMYATSEGYLEDRLQFVSKEARVEQRSLSRKVKFSSNWQKQQQRVRKLHQKITRKRRDFQHKQSSALVRQFGFLAVEDLQLMNMTASAKGTLKAPGKNVRAKSGIESEYSGCRPWPFCSDVEVQVRVV